jgi:hypothetical protein
MSSILQPDSVRPPLDDGCLQGLQCMAGSRAGFQFSYLLGAELYKAYAHVELDGLTTLAQRQENLPESVIFFWVSFES